MKVRICPRCRVNELPENRRGYCLSCWNAYWRQYHKTHLEKQRAYRREKARAYRAAHLEEIRASERARYHRRKENSPQYIGTNGKNDTVESAK